jgi:clan AA aspartic protease
MTLKPANYKYRPTEGTSLTGGKEMGYVHAEIELINEGDVEQNYRGLLPESEIRTVTTMALVDTGAWDLVINEEIQQRLNLRVVGKQPVKLADETVVEVDIVGSVWIRFEDRRAITTAIVLPGTSEVLLGAYTLEGLDAFVDPKRQKLILNPKTPGNPTLYIRQVSLSI